MCQTFLLQIEAFFELMHSTPLTNLIVYTGYDKKYFRSTKYFSLQKILDFIELS
jgi:hypothetical protein